MSEIIITILSFCLKFITEFFSKSRKTTKFHVEFSIKYSSTSQPQKEGESNVIKNP